jgi:hypothetical protein
MPRLYDPLHPLIERNADIRQISRCWVAIARRRRTASALLLTQAQVTIERSQRVMQFCQSVAQCFTRETSCREGK